ncbi:MAG TPA: (d)CMP kinase [Phycisphaerales bacterium]|nr:(d)CMP kinase [Phycisphaerales bacterium]
MIRPSSSNKASRERASASAPRGPVEVTVFSLERPLIITIDGPAGTGKTTVAENLSRRLGVEMLDTGAMYRAAAAIALEQAIPSSEQERLCRAVRAAQVHFDWRAKPPRIEANGRDYSDRIREEDVTRVVSEYAGVRALREIMVEMQRKLASEHPRLVTEGRDQGSVVFPEAKVKFYLTATAAERARRRAAQLAKRGVRVDVEALRRDIEARDASDRGRPYGALVCPDDAVVVDSTGLDEDQTVDALYRIVMEKSRA